jgi:hypothetical protein
MVDNDVSSSYWDIYYVILIMLCECGMDDMGVLPGASNCMHRRMIAAVQRRAIFKFNAQKTIPHVALKSHLTDSYMFFNT